MKKNKIINLREVADVEVDADKCNGSFVLTFRAGECCHKYVKIHLERWFLGFIAARLWDVIKSEKGEVERLEESMTGGGE